MAVRAQRLGLVFLLLAVAGALVWLALAAGDTEPVARPPPDTPAAAHTTTKPARVPRPRGGEAPVPRAPDDPGPVDTSDGDPQSRGRRETPVTTVRVTVLDEGGARVEGATVHAVDLFFLLMEGGPYPSEYSTASTDADGVAVLRWEWDVLPQVAFLAVDGGTAAVSERRALVAGETVEVTLTLGVAARVHGTLVDANGVAVPDAKVHVVFQTTDGVGASLATDSGADGTFRFPGYPLERLRGSFRVDARAPGFAPWSARFPVREVGDELRIELRPSLSVTGRCIDVAGKPVPGVTVRTADQSGERTTDAEGRFALDDLSPEHGATVLFLPTGHAAVVRQVEAGRPGEVDLGDVLLREGGAIAGRVVDGAEGGLRGVLVELIHGPTGVMIRQVIAGAEGRFSILHVPDGEHSLRVSQILSDGNPLRTELAGVRAGDEAVRVVLSGALTVLVKFLDEGSRTPVGVDSVKLRATPVGGGDDVAWTYGGGGITSVRAEFEQAGTYDFAVEIPGYEVGTAANVAVDATRGTVIEVLFRKAPE